MLTVYVHPNNLEAFRKRLTLSPSELNPFEWSILCQGYNLVGDPGISETKETGKFVLPGGAVVTREKVRVASRWVTYGPEDLEFLLWAGIVKPEVDYPVISVDWDKAYRDLYEFRMVEELTGWQVRND